MRNYTRNGVRRNDITVGIGLDDDIEEAQQTLLRLARGDARVRNEPPPIAFVAGLGDSAISVTLRVPGRPPPTSSPPSSNSPSAPS